MLVVELQHELDLSSVGAKSANLGRLIAHGFSVPPGFALTRRALELFLDETGLLAPVQKLLSNPAGSMHEERTEAYGALRAIVHYSHSTIFDRLGRSVGRKAIY